MFVAVIPLLILLTSSTLQANESPEGWGPGHMMYWPWGGMFMMIPMFLLVIGAIFLIIFMLRKVSDTGQHFHSGQETPLDILKKRYARGEITREEFEKMKRDLS